MTTGLDVVQLTAIGAASGMRTFARPARLLRTAGLSAFSNPGRLDRALTRKPSRSAIITAGARETVFNKPSRLPDSVKPQSLALRALIGATAAGLLAHRRGQPLLLGVALGSVGAVAGAYVFHRVRRALTESVGLPDWPAALVEDLIAVSAARLALRR